ncbi:MAG TPA: hypothetical protein PLK99_13585, partial [Burkholderiales bacterium]|nr:hypothetical protein [Burkholderiales bacterium]
MAPRPTATHPVNMIRKRVTLKLLYRNHIQPGLIRKLFQGTGIEEEKMLAPVSEILECLIFIQRQQ